MAHYKHSVCILMLAFAFTSCDFDDVLDTTDVVYDLVMCGNGQLDYGEECDDGNTISGDGCSYDCKKETSQTPTPVCGNGKHEAGEECDDGNTISGDGCSYDCKKETPSSNCPEEGDSCIGDKSLCCDNNVYDCISGQYQIMRCTGNTYCDSSKGFYDCVESCSSKDAEMDFLEYDYYCEEGEFELFACEKGDSGKYGIFGGYYATGYCWDDGIILECSSEYGDVDEIECNVCVEGESSDPYNDICIEP